MPDHRQGPWPTHRRKREQRRRAWRSAHRRAARERRAAVRERRPVDPVEGRADRLRWSYK